jgi:hypothetical protein
MTPTYQERQFTLRLPTDLAQLQFPPALNQRLQHLLDQQDQGVPLTPTERDEAEGLVALSELLTLLKLNTKMVNSNVKA